MQILILPGLTLPELRDSDLAAIEAAAGPGARITVARDREAALAAAPETEIVLGVVSRSLFAAMPKLRWVHAIAAGVDFLLFPEMRESSVILTGEKGLVGGHLADHAFALLLALTRRLAQAVRLGPGSWQQRMEMRREELELEGLVMGIVGFGGTGRAIARRARAFGMRCRAVDRDPVPAGEGVERVGSLDELPALLGESDVVALGCPLTEETRRLFDASTFARMKPGAYLINVTRGEIIDGEALVEALREERLAGAGLDVTPEEPLPADHPLWQLPNVVITPHTAGASQHRAPRNLDRFCQNLRRLRSGEPLLGQIDKQLGY